MLYEDISCGMAKSAREEINAIILSVGRTYRNGGYDPIIREHRPFILESFYYADAETERLIPYYGDFLLDSGAFTFLQGSNRQSIKWEEYIERYSDFIVKNQVNNFFELDIDSVVGYDKVKQFRSRVEKMTGRQSIPVWHPSRGYDEFKKMCDEYPRVAIGGIVIKEIPQKYYSIFPQMIHDAHQRGTKVHGLGFTNLKLLELYKFDSVDSTAWTTGNRFGYLYKFNGKTMEKIVKPHGTRISDSRKTALNNYCEWIKFQKYAITHL